MIIDFHTHILPSVDDGSKNVEESIAMLRMEAEQGIKKVVLTPHFYANHDSPKRFIERRSYAETKLLEAMNGDEPFPKLIMGAEVHYFEGISDCEFLHTLAIGDKKCILIEMPMRKWTDRMLVELEGIKQKQKLIPIIAHIDRYIGPFKTNGIVESLSELPVVIQANASFFIKRLSRKLALNLLSKRKIQLLGSDCHRSTDRTPNLGEAIRIIKSSLGDSAISYINSNEQKFVSE